MSVSPTDPMLAAMNRLNAAVEEFRLAVASVIEPEDPPEPNPPACGDKPMEVTN